MRQFKETLPEDGADILDKYGYWLSALANGDIPACSEMQRQFVRVAKGIRQPETEYERAWMNFTSGLGRTRETDSERSVALYSKAVQLRKKRASGRAVRYEDVVQAFTQAAQAGSHKALDWLIEQGMTPLKPNSFWDCEHRYRKRVNEPDAKWIDSAPDSPE